MKITVKTLQQEQFTAEVDPNGKVLDVKNAIESLKGHNVASQKLIFSGKILKDESNLSELKFEENSFFVLMVTKPATTKKATSSTAPQKTTEEKKPDQSKIAASSTTATATLPKAPENPAENTNVTKDDKNQVSSNEAFSMLATGDTYNTVVNNLCEMGFSKEEVTKAMRASFNNPDRAVEYLMNGIPPELEVVPPTSAPTPATATTDNPSPQTNSENLFTAAAQQATAQQHPASGGNDGSLDFLRQDPQFQQLRQVVQQNPQLLQPLLQQLGASNPQLFQLISQNQDAFVNLLRGGGEDEAEGEGEAAAPDGTQYIRISEEEQEAINRLEGLGFDRAHVVEAYFACDKDETLAANYLFEHEDED